MRSRPRLPALTGASLCWGGLRKTWGYIHADEQQPPQNLRGVFRGILGSVHTDRSPGLLRTHGEGSGRCGSTSTLTGAPGPLQDLRGGFRKLWARTHPDRSPWAASGHVGRLLKNVAQRPLWQELKGPSGHKLSLLEAEDRNHRDRSPGHLRTSGDASGGRGATSTQPDADVLRTPSVDFGKYGDASMRTEDPSLVRACGEA